MKSVYSTFSAFGSNATSFSLFFCGLFLLPLLFCVSCEKAQEDVLKVGDQAPQFEAVDMNKNIVSSQKALGKPMILRFFDPDCKYCRADTAIFNNYYTQYKDKGLQVVYLDTEPNPTDIEKFITELNIVFPVVLDTEREVANLFRVQVVPQTIILDPQHTIIGAILGGVSEAELDDMLHTFF